MPGRSEGAAAARPRPRFPSESLRPQQRNPPPPPAISCQEPLLRGAPAQGGRTSRPRDTPCASEPGEPEPSRDAGGGRTGSRERACEARGNVLRRGWGGRCACAGRERAGAGRAGRPLPSLAVLAKMADFLPSRSVLSGCFPGCLLTSGEAEQQRKSKEIDKCLNREKTYVKRLVKILLLGAGESGKSTFLKQMRIIHGQDWDRAAREEFRATIYSNVIKGASAGGGLRAAGPGAGTWAGVLGLCGRREPRGPHRRPFCCRPGRPGLSAPVRAGCGALSSGRPRAAWGERRFCPAGSRPARPFPGDERWWMGKRCT